VPNVLSSQTAPFDVRNGFEFGISVAFDQVSSAQGVIGQFTTPDSWQCYFISGALNFLVRNSGGTNFNVTDTLFGTPTIGVFVPIRGYYDQGRQKISIAVGNAGYNTEVSVTGTLNNLGDVLKIGAYLGANPLSARVAKVVVQKGVQNSGWRDSLLSWLEATPS
jgi:hypothetical protein